MRFSMKKADLANQFSGDKRDGLNWYIKASYFLDPWEQTVQSMKMKIY